MYKIIIILGVLIISACKESPKKELQAEQPKQSQPQEKKISDAFAIEILDDEALQLIDPNTAIELMASGFTWTEGPLWIEDGRYLLFSDIPNNKVFKLDSDNKVSTYLHPSGYTDDTPMGKEPGSNGLILNTDGSLVLLQHGDRRVAMMNRTLDRAAAEYTTIVDNYQGKRLNSPNDGFFDPQGNLYFTDPPYGLPKGMEDPSKELDFQGVYCLLVTGELLLLDQLTRPNGIALSPDGNTLYVAVSDRQHAVWYQYDVLAPGRVDNKKIFYDVTHLMGQEGQQGLPDGMKVNSKGYIYATGPGGLWIFNPKAKPIARIYTGQKTSNCALTKDEKSLFLTADDHILKVDLK